MDIEDLVYYTICINYVADGPGSFIKLVNKLFEVCLALSFRKDRLQKMKLVSELSLHCRHSSCGSLADSMIGDLPGAVGDVLQAICKQNSPDVYGSYRSICCLV
jgi:hypothetical protein